MATTLRRTGRLHPGAAEDGDAPAHRGGAALRRAPEAHGPGGLRGRPRDPRRRSYRYRPSPFEQTLLATRWPGSRARSATTRRRGSSSRATSARTSAMSRRASTCTSPSSSHVPGTEIVDAIRSAAPPGLEVRVFAGMLRSATTALRATIDSLRTGTRSPGSTCTGSSRCRPSPGPSRCGSGCQGGEGHGVPRRANSTGPARVREAISSSASAGAARRARGRGPRRRAACRRPGATFDVCPLSNVGLGVFPDIASHPLRSLMRAGVNCTVSTNDPLCFANTLTEEYSVLAAQAGFTRAQLASSPATAGGGGLSARPAAGGGSPR